MVVSQITMAATLKASNNGLELVDAARRKKGWNKSEEAWTGLATTSQATLRRFWAGLPIRSETFEKICKAVGITDWTAIVEIREESKDKETVANGKRLSFAIAGSIDETDKQKLDAIVALLKKMGGDTTIEMVDIDEGSIKLILKGSDEGLQRIQQLFDSGTLTNIEGVEVLEVKYLTKNELADIIRTNGAEVLDLEGVDLSSANLSGADLSGADLSSADLSGADLSSADLNRANLREVYLREADLSSADLREADLISANLINADLRSADLRSAAINRANLSNADLGDADLNRASLREADLNRASLREADLSSADLREANLSSAYLNFANLREANLSGAILSGSIFGNNPGLSEEDKVDMQRRDAIFEDSPDSDVPSFVIR